MDFLSGKIKTIYFKYLSAAFGSSGLEHYLQFRAPDGNRGICPFQYDQGKSGRGYQEVQ